MRTYILALTRYSIMGFMVLYTVLSLYQLRNIGHARRRKVCLYLLILIFLINALSFLTIAVGNSDLSYFGLFIAETIGFAASVYIYMQLYPRGNLTLYIHVIMMLSVGLIVIARIDFSEAIKQFVIAVIGLVITIVVPYFMRRFRFYKNLTYIYAAAGAAALLAVLLIGNYVYGSNLNFTIGGITMQPSEFVKILFVLFIASSYYEASSFREVFITGVIAAMHVLILIASNDLGSALIFYVVFFFMTYLATGKPGYLILGAAAGAAGAILCVRVFAHVRTRFIAWRDPWSVIDGDGYQITQSLFAISGGGLFGLGLTQGTPGDIPFVDKDFIFAAICEEMGLIFAMCVMIMCIVIFINIIWIALNFDDRFYRFAAFGFAVVYIFQTFLTIGGDVRFIPLTGVTLPLVSYGGSSVLATIIMFAMVQGIYIMQQDQIAAQRRRNGAYRRRRNVYPDYGRRASGYERIPIRGEIEGGDETERYGRNAGTGYASRKEDTYAYGARPERTYGTGNGARAERLRTYSAGNRTRPERLRTYGTGNWTGAEEDRTYSTGSASSGERTYGTYDTDHPLRTEKMYDAYDTDHLSRAERPYSPEQPARTERMYDRTDYPAEDAAKSECRRVRPDRNADSEGWPDVTGFLSGYRNRPEEGRTRNAERRDDSDPDATDVFDQLYDSLFGDEGDSEENTGYSQGNSGRYNG